MTQEQKAKITKLRADGYGYIKIAQLLGISENTVKSFCRRNNLTGKVADETPKIQSPADEGKHLCLNCGVCVEQNPGRKEKRFCSDECRIKWWNSNLDRVKRKAVYEYICPHCGKPFTVYGNSRRKYCSHECYVADRFGGGPDE
ncbi:helix-turn-helix domain-containing protein [Anaerocolumna sp. MB42-C2]|uniref:helix-turn-helix domain-containing protein n=1 Tax=Anaerocolumna sp. MB42-C2 TaxID=3070997 RepID=UPI0027E0A5A8|nr:RNA polymerase subunit sigma-70 [Anaerocolumna sp. MB42-C2]WMJ87805.1 RNA polymerase subunit sigma-70 [Anaerocolumna sp. MB42-C2]